MELGSAPMAWVALVAGPQRAIGEVPPVIGPAPVRIWPGVGFGKQDYPIALSLFDMEQAMEYANKVNSRLRIRAVSAPAGDELAASQDRLRGQARQGGRHGA
jgi:hypothetical protein